MLEYPSRIAYCHLSTTTVVSPFPQGCLPRPSATPTLCAVPASPWAAEVLKGECAEELDEGGTMTRPEESLQVARRDQNMLGWLGQGVRAACKYTTSHKAVVHQKTACTTHQRNWETHYKKELLRSFQRGEECEEGADDQATVAHSLYRTYDQEWPQEADTA